MRAILLLLCLFVPLPLAAQTYQVTVGGEVTDTANLTGFDVRVNGGAWVDIGLPTPNGSTYSHRFDLPAGLYTLEMRPKNGTALGTISTLRDVRVGPVPTDTTPPAVMLYSPAHGTRYAKGVPITFTAAVSDAGGLASVALKWQAGTTNTYYACAGVTAPDTCVQNGNVVTFTLYALTGTTGTKYWTVRAVDLAGNASEPGRRSVSVN